MSLAIYVYVYLISKQHHSATTSMWYSLIIITLRLLFLFSTGHAVDEGVPCTVEDTDGQCVFLKNCPKARVDLNDGRSLPKCGLVGSEVLVCCPNVAAEERHAERTPGETAKQKCKEYAKFVFTNRTIPHPLRGRKPFFVSRPECGFKIAPLVSGGTEARQKEFPHMAAIGYNTSFGLRYLCGGSLISDLYVLTAAHCIRHPEFGNASEVKLGATQLMGRYSGVNYKIAGHIYHPEYKFKFYHDIALLKLAEPARLSVRARPACLFTAFDIPANRSLICGWGREVDGGPLNNDLMKVTLDIFESDRCNLTFKSEIERSRSRLRQGILVEDHICAGSAEVKDACQGDSGGPMQIYHQPVDGAQCMYDIIGVVSFGNACGEDQTSGVYTRVSNYIKWIEDIVWP